MANTDSPYVVIVGCGKVGQKIVSCLYEEKFSIAVIDNDADEVADIINEYDVLGVVGNGASEQALEEADIVSADIFIAVSQSDEFNLLCCALVKSIKDIPTIARVRTPVYTDSIHLLKKSLGITMIINPELETAVEAARILNLPAAYSVTVLGGGESILSRAMVPAESKIVGKTLMEIDNMVAGDFLIPIVYRSGTDIYIPDGDFKIEAEDNIALLSTKQVAHNFYESMGFNNTKVKNCMIVGGGRTAYFLARELIKNKTKVKIIEQNIDRCKELSDLLPEAIIIHGDGSNEGLLLEEGLTDTQGFVPFTGIDEENVVLALHAKANSDAKIVLKFDRGSFIKTVRELDAGTMLFTRNITSDAIVAFARTMKSTKGSKIQSLYSMYDGKIEVLEFLIDTSSDATDTPLKDLKLKPGTVISTIRRGRRIIIPKGNDKILKGDIIDIVTTNIGLKDLDEILDDNK